ARRLLAPGGNLFIAVPNIDSLQFRWFSSNWFGLDLPRHLTHFAPWTLHLMLERAGFRVGKACMIRHSDWLRNSANLACAKSKTAPWQRMLTARSASRIAAWYSSITNQCDCMVIRSKR